MAQTNKDQDAMEKTSKSESTSAEILEGALADDSNATSQSASANKAAQSTLKKHEKRDSSKNEDGKNSSSSSKTSKSSPKSTVKPTRTSRLVSFVLLLLVVFSLFLLLMGLQNTQALNELRNDLNQVQHKQANILDQQDTLSEQMGAAPSSSSEQAQMFENLSEEVAKLQTQVQTASSNSIDVENMQASQAEFESKIHSELQQALETVKTLQTPVQTSEGEVDLSPLMQKIAILEQQYNNLNQQLADKSQAVEPSDEKPVEQSQSLLNPSSLQQWIFETNTQWLLGASAESTIEKLNAIEQAAVNGGLTNVTALARLIGQDVAALKQWFEISKQPLPLLDELYGAVSALAPPKLELQQAESMPQANTQAVQADALQVGEVAEQETAWQRLLSRLSDMVTIKNRQTTGEPTTVEALLQHDLQKQRLLLLIERMEWSAQHESQARYEMSIDQVQKFVNQNFMNHSKQFEELLKPFRAFERKGRQPLVTAGFHVKPLNN